MCCKNLGQIRKHQVKRKIKSRKIQVTYPGEKVQVDVKYVPTVCLTKELQERGEKFYQYTAIDEFTRIRYTWFTNEHSTYMSSEFVKRAVRYYPFKIETVQTDNGFEFTNRLNWNKSKRNQKTMFEETLEKLKIKYRQIKSYTPKENGKVERSHRKDQERFYYKKVFYSFEDLRIEEKIGENNIIIF